MKPSKIQTLNLTLGLMLVGCATPTTLPTFSVCPPPHQDPIDYDVQWPELHYRYPLDGPIHIGERLYDDNRGATWHIMVGFPEIMNWDYCQTFFENQGLEVHYTNNIIYMRQVR